MNVITYYERRGADGYVVQHCPGHPLSWADGCVARHRRALFDALYPMHPDPCRVQDPCHWCGYSLPWKPLFGADTGVHVDHINGKPGDDRVENLVPSCVWCNQNRQWIDYVDQDGEFWEMLLGWFHQVPPSMRTSPITIYSDLHDSVTPEEIAALAQRLAQERGTGGEVRSLPEGHEPDPWLTSRLLAAKCRLSKETATLVSALRPTTIEQLAAVPGIGPAAVEKYGERVLAVVRSNT